MGSREQMLAQVESSREERSRAVLEARESERNYGPNAIALAVIAKMMLAGRDGPSRVYVLDPREVELRPELWPLRNALRDARAVGRSE